MAHELAVWLFSDRVGALSLVNGRVTFRYDADWLANPASVPLSHSLPLRQESFDDHAARPFFAGLLPEGRLRDLIAQRVHVSRQNEFGLLDSIGGECAGAVTLMRAEKGAPNNPADGHVLWLDDAGLAGVLEELPRRPMLAGKDGLRLSLAGAQDKLPVVFDGQRIGLPQDGYPSTHIMKPEIVEVEDSVSNEAFCLELAGVMRLPVANAQVRSVGDKRFLLVERYDRVPVGAGPARRLHQDDFCHALGVVSELKYQNEGGPSLADCFGLIRTATRPSVTNLVSMLDYVIFNTLVGNHDAHGKNFSLLYAGATPTLAPLYDVLCTAIYPRLTEKMAMKLGGKYKFTEVTEKHWERFAEETGLGKAQMRKRVMVLASSLPIAAVKLAAGSEEYAASEVVGRIVELIERRAGLVVKRLTAGTDT